MPDLPGALARLAAEAQWPPTPALAETVRAAIEAQPAAAGGRRGGPRAWWRARGRSRRPLLAALLALLVGGGVLASPGAGSGLLERLGLRGATVTKVEHLPLTRLGRDLRLGERTTLAGAQRRAGFTLLRPAALGAPPGVYLDRAEGVVTLAYRARSGRPILFTQVPGSARRYVQKFVTEGTRRVRVGGVAGLLLRGPHGVVFDARDGATRVQESRLAKNTLMWERGGLLLRLEAEQPLGEMLRIARSVR
jgi:hypothetical protein